jgi:hypothetical protein
MRFDRTLRSFRLAGLIAIFSLCHGAADAQREPEGVATLSLTDPKYERVVVANVGDLTITAQEFLLNYAFGPAFVKRQNNAKLRHLNFMINEKLLALDGYGRGLQNARSTRETLAEIEGDLATEELYQQDVANNVVVSTRDIAEGIQKGRETLGLQWIFSPTERGIATYHHLLRDGAPFDSVFALQLRDSIRAEDRSLQATRFDLAMKNPVLAGIVDSLAAGTISLPIHVDDGWYIVRITDRQRSPIMTQSEEEKLREDVHRALVQRKSDRLSDQYVNQIILDAKPTIERRAFDLVEAYLARTIVPHDQFVHWGMADLLLKKWGPVDVADIEPSKGQPIVTYRHGTFTVADFLRWYDARSTGIHLPLTSPQAFFASLEGLVWRMVRDKLLVQRAFARRLQLHAVVQKQKKWWEEKILYELEKSMLADSIPMDAVSLRKYYGSHQRDFRDAARQVRPYESVSDDVRRAYYADALTERMLHRLLALRTRFGAAIDTSALESLPVDDQRQPGAIDVYAVKKGGTFPRPAFPSIDYRWQEWN